MLVLCFLVGFCYCFCFIFLVFRSRNCLEKFYRCQVWFFWVRSLFLRLFSSTPFAFCLFFLLRDIDQVVTGHPLHTHLFFWFFFFFVSRRFCLFRPFWPCVPLLGVFPGCHSGPRAFLGFSLDLLRPFLLGREAARVFVCCSCFVFLPFCFAATPFLE